MPSSRRRSACSDGTELRNARTGSSSSGISNPSGPSPGGHRTGCCFRKEHDPRPPRKGYGSSPRTPTQSTARRLTRRTLSQDPRFAGTPTLLDGESCLARTHGHVRPATRSRANNRPIGTTVDSRALLRRTVRKLHSKGRRRRKPPRRTVKPTGHQLLARTFHFHAPPYSSQMPCRTDCSWGRPEGGPCCTMAYVTAQFYRHFCRKPVLTKLAPRIIRLQSASLPSRSYS